MVFTREELEALKLIIDYHIISAEGGSPQEHIALCRGISKKLNDGLSREESLSRDAEELKQILSRDSTMSDVSMGDLHEGALGQYPSEGPLAWLFHYKNAFVILRDESNGHFSFCRELK